MIEHNILVNKVEQQLLTHSYDSDVTVKRTYDAVAIDFCEVTDNVWSYWNSPELDSHLSYVYFDSPNPYHITTRRLGNEWLKQLGYIQDGQDLVTTIHQKFSSFCHSSSLNARTLMNIEWSLIHYLAQETGVVLDDVRAYESINLFNQYDTGIAWLTCDGWQSLSFYDSQIKPLNMESLSSIEFMGHSSTTLAPNHQRVDQHLNVINGEHALVIDYVKSMFGDHLVGLSISDIIHTVHSGIQSFKYIADIGQEWQSLDTIFDQGGGDCEDLAHLEISLLLRALNDAGYAKEANQLSIVSGLVGSADHQVGHSVIQFSHEGHTYVIDSTSTEALVHKQAYVDVTGWRQVATYSDMSNLTTLRQASQFNTAAELWTDGDNNINDLGQFETEFLMAIGMFDEHAADDGYFSNVYNFFRSVTDQETSGDVTTTYFSGLDYYGYNPLVSSSLYFQGYGDGTYSSLAEAQAAYRRDQARTDEDTSEFWDAEYELNIPDVDLTDTVTDPFDGTDTVMVGEDTVYFDTPFNTHLGAMKSALEAVRTRRLEMNENLNSTTLNKYVGQQFSGYFVYDYSRMMKDYQEIMDKTQVVIAYLTAFTSMANTYNWIASQVSYDSNPNENVKSRQSLIKTVQSVMVKFLDELEYFIPLFIETYDELNSSLYADYTQDIENQFNSFDSIMKDMFEFGSETIKKNYFLEKAHAEYFAAVSKNRLNVQQTDITTLNSGALLTSMNFSDPNANIFRSSSKDSAINFVNLLRQIEYDITNDVYHQVPTVSGATDSDGESFYLSSLHYYFPWYFSDSELTLYESDLETDSGFNTSQAILLKDSDFYTGSVFSAIGYDTVEIGDKAYSYYDWINNLSGNIFSPIDKNTYVSPTQDSVDLFSNFDIDNDNYKTSAVYQYLYAQAMPFNEFFETELYVNGAGNSRSDDLYYGSYLTFSDGTLYEDTTITEWSSHKDTLVDYMERKRRLNANDFVDLMDIYVDGSDDDLGRSFQSEDGGLASTSLDLYDSLKTIGMLDQYGVFTDEFAAIIASTSTGSIIQTLEDDYGLSLTYGTHTNDGTMIYDFEAAVKTDISKRIVRIFDMDEWLVDQTNYDFTVPKLDVTMPSGISYGDFSYITIYGDNDLFSDSDNMSDYAYLRDSFEGNDPMFSAYEAAMIDQASDAATVESDASSRAYWGDYLYTGGTSSDDNPMVDGDQNNIYGFTDDYTDGGDSGYGEEDGQYAYSYYYDSHLGATYENDGSEGLLDWADFDGQNFSNTYLSWDQYVDQYTTTEFVQYISEADIAASLGVSSEIDLNGDGFFNQNTTFIPVYSFENFSVSAYADDDDVVNGDSADDHNYFDSLKLLIEDELFGTESQDLTSTKSMYDFDVDLQGQTLNNFNYYFSSDHHQTDINNNYYLESNLGTSDLNPDAFFEAVKLDSGLTIFNDDASGDYLSDYWYVYDSNQEQYLYYNNGEFNYTDYNPGEYYADSSGVSGQWVNIMESSDSNTYSEYYYDDVSIYDFGTEIESSSIVGLLSDRGSELPHVDEYFDHPYMNSQYLDMYGFSSDRSFGDVYTNFYATDFDLTSTSDTVNFFDTSQLSGEMIITEDLMREFYIQNNATYSSLDSDTIFDSISSVEASDLSHIPTGFQNSVSSIYNAPSTSYGDWQISNFVEQVSTYDQTFSTPIEYTLADETESVDPGISLPSGKLGWEYDYGVSNRSGYDTRVVSSDTNDDDDLGYQDVGPIMVGEHSFIDQTILVNDLGYASWADSGYDSNGNGILDVNGEDALDLALMEWKALKDSQAGVSSGTSVINYLDIYSGELSWLPDSTVEEYRQINSLEKELTPVHSYNDQSEIFSLSDLYEFAGIQNESDDLKSDFIHWLESNRFISPSFRRNQSSDDVLGAVYVRYGYSILEDFEKITDSDFINAWTSKGVNYTVTQLSQFVGNIHNELVIEWESESRDDMIQFWGKVKGDSFDNPGQFLRTVGQSTESDLYGVGEMPFLAFKWEELKNSHNGMMATHNRIRIYFFVVQAVISALQSATQKIDSLATSGVQPIEANLQLYEKRIAKQQERHRQLISKTNQLIQVNNAYYKQKIQSFKDGDLGLRVAKATSLYGSLAGAAIYAGYLGLSFMADSACLAALTNPASAAWCATLQSMAGVAWGVFLGVQITANLANVAEKALRTAQEWGTPQMMDTDLLSFDTQNSDYDLSQFKDLIQYKKPFSLDIFSNAIKYAWEADTVDEDGTSWLNDIPVDFASLYQAYSPTAGTNGYYYQSDAIDSDEWKAAVDTHNDFYGDCEDFSALAATIMYDDIKQKGATSWVASNYENRDHVGTGDIELVSGILGAADISANGNLSFTPEGHTVVMLNTNANDALLTDYLGSGLNVSDFVALNQDYTLSDMEDIIVVDLLADSEMNVLEYHETYGYFRPKFYLSEPGQDIALAAETTMMDLFAWDSASYNPWDDIISRPEPKGPQDLPPANNAYLVDEIGDGNYWYTEGANQYFRIDQTSFRHSILYTYSDGVMSTEILDDRIEYGESSFRGVPLTGNYDSDRGSYDGDIDSPNDIADAATTWSDLPFSYSDFNINVLFDYQDTSTPNDYESDTIIPSSQPMMIDHSNQLQSFEMQEILKLEFEEHALLLDMYQLGSDPSNFINVSSNISGDHQYYVIDWPVFQDMQHRLFVTQQKMKQLFVLLKLKSEFLNVIAARLNEGDVKSVSSAMDHIFNSHFTKMADTVQTLQTVMMNVQSNYQNNYQVRNQQVDATYAQYTQIATEAIMNSLLFIPRVGQAVEGMSRPFANIFAKLIKFFGNEYNPYYLESVDDMRDMTAVSDEDAYYSNLEELMSEYGDSENSLDYSKMMGLFYSSGSESNDGLNDVVSEFWNASGYDGILGVDGVKDLYNGNVTNDQYVSVENNVLKAMSNRHFSKSGDDLMFLGDFIYSMSGEKEFSDDDFLDWMQERISAEILVQIYYSMYTSSLKSITANLGLSQLGGNDSMEHATSMTADIGQHYFDLQNTLMTWEQEQIRSNELRFAQFKQLDQIILEGMMTAGVALIGGLTCGMASQFSKAGWTIGQRVLTMSFTMFMEVAQMGLEMADLLYCALDAQEKNRSMSELTDEDENEDAESIETHGLGKNEVLAKNLEMQENQFRDDQNKLGHSTINRAGDGTIMNRMFGIQTHYVDHSVKIQLKRKIKEMYKTLESLSTIGASQAEFIKRLASNLGYFVSQHNIGSAIGRLQGIAKNADEKILDVKFEALEAYVKRENQQSQAMQQAIINAISIATSFGVKYFMHKTGLSKRKFVKGAPKNNQQFIGGMEQFFQSTLQSMLQSALLDQQHQALEDDMVERKKELGTQLAHSQSEIIAGKSQAFEDVQSSLELRQLSAQFFSASTLEARAIVDQLKKIADMIGAPLYAMYQSIVAMCNAKLTSIKASRSRDFVNSNNTYSKGTLLPPTKHSFSSEFDMSVNKPSITTSEAYSLNNLDNKLKISIEKNDGKGLKVDSLFALKDQLDQGINPLNIDHIVLDDIIQKRTSSLSHILFQFLTGKTLGKNGGFSKLIDTMLNRDMSSKVMGVSLMALIPIIALISLPGKLLNDAYEGLRDRGLNQDDYDRYEIMRNRHFESKYTQFKQGELIGFDDHEKVFLLDALLYDRTFDSSKFGSIIQRLSEDDPGFTALLTYKDPHHPEQGRYFDDLSDALIGDYWDGNHQRMIRKMMLRPDGQVSNSLFDFVVNKSKDYRLLSRLIPQLDMSNASERDFLKDNAMVYFKGLETYHGRVDLAVLDMHNAEQRSRINKEEKQFFSDMLASQMIANGTGDHQTFMGQDRILVEYYITHSATMHASLKTGIEDHFQQYKDNHGLTAFIQKSKDSIHEQFKGRSDEDQFKMTQLIGPYTSNDVTEKLGRTYTEDLARALQRDRHLDLIFQALYQDNPGLHTLDGIDNIKQQFSKLPLIQQTGASLKRIIQCEITKRSNTISATDPVKGSELADGVISVNEMTPLFVLPLEILQRLDERELISLKKSLDSSQPIHADGGVKSTNLMFIERLRQNFMRAAVGNLAVVPTSFLKRIVEIDATKGGSGTIPIISAIDISVDIPTSTTDKPVMDKDGVLITVTETSGNSDMSLGNSSLTGADTVQEFYIHKKAMKRSIRLMMEERESLLENVSDLDTKQQYKLKLVQCIIDQVESMGDLMNPDIPLSRLNVPQLKLLSELSDFGYHSDYVGEMVDVFISDCETIDDMEGCFA